MNATSASIRLTKKDGAPFLCLTITNSSLSSTPYSALAGANQRGNAYDHEDRESTEFSAGSREREVTITQDVPIRVLSVANVEGIHEPRCREPDVHILLPPLMQLKSISDRFTKLALASKNQSSGLNTIGPRLEMAANMHGCLRMSIKTDAMNISSVWTGLSNPELDPGQVEGGQDGIANHPSTRMKAKGAADGRGEEGWAKVRIDGRDWGKVMSVGRLGGKVIACFCDDHALILYVYLASEGDDEGSVLTVSTRHTTLITPNRLTSTVLRQLLQRLRMALLWWDSAIFFFPPRDTLVHAIYEHTFYGPYDHRPRINTDILLKLFSGSFRLFTTRSSQSSISSLSNWKGNIARDSGSSVILGKQQRNSRLRQF